MELELWQLARLARRWWWLLVLGPVIGAVVAFVVSGREVPEYSAYALLRINPAQVTGDFSVDDSQSVETLAETYRLLIYTAPVLTPVIDELDLNETVVELADRISSWQIQDSQLLRIAVSDTDPSVAADIANGVARSLALYVSSEVTTVDTAARATVDEQIAETTGQIENITQQIQTLDESPISANPSTAAEISALQSEANQLQALRADLLATAHSMDLNAALAREQVTVAIESETPSITPVASPTLLTVFGGLAGLLVAAAAVSVLGFLDRTVRTRTDFVSLTGSPQLAAVPSVGRPRDPRDRLFMVNQPQGEAAEAIRFLRVNLAFAEAGEKLGTLAICSPGEHEGKSTIAANLAVALARADQPTVLIDADLRDPIQHEIFGASNEAGLSELLAGHRDAWDTVAVPTSVPGLTLIPSGPVPPNPADLLSHDRLPQLLDQLRKTGAVVILDTPAMQFASDALVVAAHANGIVLVAQSGKTRLDALETAAAALQPAGVRVLGVVLNGESELPETAAGYRPERVTMSRQAPAVRTANETAVKQQRST